MHEIVRQRAVEAAEVVLEVCEESLPVVPGKRLSREPPMLDSAPENRAAEGDAAFFEKRSQIAEDCRLRLRRRREAVEDPVERDRGERSVPSSSGSRTLALTTRGE